MRKTILFFFNIFIFICCKSGEHSEILLTEPVQEVGNEKQRSNSADNDKRPHMIFVINGKDSVLTFSATQNWPTTSILPVNDVNPFVGYWNYTDESTLGPFDEPASMFSIRMEKFANNQIKGNYSAIALYGDKIDCDIDDNENWENDSFNCRLYGILESDRLWVNFNTSRGGIGGEAVITLIDEKHIKWELTKWPHAKKGYGITEYWGPSKAILSKMD